MAHCLRGFVTKRNTFHSSHNWFSANIKILISAVLTSFAVWPVFKLLPQNLLWKSFGGLYHPVCLLFFSFLFYLQSSEECLYSKKNSNLLGITWALRQTVIAVGEVGGKKNPTQSPLFFHPCKCTHQSWNISLHKSITATQAGPSQVNQDDFQALLPLTQTWVSCSSSV